MPYIPFSHRAVGLYVPTTNIWNAQTINTIDVNGPDFKKLVVDLYQNINNISLVLNKKDSALFDTSQFVTGALWYNPNPNRINVQRPEYRLVINFGALGVATKSVAHGITWTASTRIVDFWAVATKTTAARSALKIPYASSAAVANNVELFIDATNVTISNGIDRSMYDSCTVVIEFLQND